MHRTSCDKTGDGRQATAARRAAGDRPPDLARRTRPQDPDPDPDPRPGPQRRTAEKDAVRTCAARGSATAAAHLLGLGKRQIGYVAGPRSIRQCVERGQGAGQAASVAGLAPETAITTVEVPAMTAREGQQGAASARVAQLDPPAHPPARPDRRRTAAGRMRPPRQPRAAAGDFPARARGPRVHRGPYAATGERMNTHAAVDLVRRSEHLPPAGRRDRLGPRRGRSARSLVSPGVPLRRQRTWPTPPSAPALPSRTKG